MSEYDAASLQIAEGLATIEIGGPGRNLLNPAKMAGLEAQLRAADAAPEVSGIVLTGNGSTFCGGLDLGAIGEGSSPVDFAAALVSLLRLLPTLSKPIAAAVNGDAVASGSALVAACDYAVAASDNRLGTYEASVGVWPMVAQVPLVHRIGVRAAMETIASGEPFTAERARELGLINLVTEPEEVMSATRAWLLKAARQARRWPLVGQPSMNWPRSITRTACNWRWRSSAKFSTRNRNGERKRPGLGPGRHPR